MRGLPLSTSSLGTLGFRQLPSLQLGAHQKGDKYAPLYNEASLETTVQGQLIFADMARKLAGDAQELTEHFAACTLSHKFRDARVVENVVEVEVDGVRTIQVDRRSCCPMTYSGPSGGSLAGPLMAMIYACCKGTSSTCSMGERMSAAAGSMKLIGNMRECRAWSKASLLGRQYSTGRMISTTELTLFMPDTGGVLPSRSLSCKPSNADVQ